MSGSPSAHNAGEGPSTLGWQRSRTPPAGSSLPMSSSAAGSSGAFGADDYAQRLAMARQRSSSSLESRHSHQPYTASPLRSALHPGMASSPQHTTPSASPEISSARLVSPDGFASGGHSADNLRQAQRFQQAFMTGDGQDASATPRAESASQFAGPQQMAAQPLVRWDSPSEAGAGERRYQPPPSPAYDAPSAAGEATASSRFVSSSLGTTQHRSVTPSNQSDYRLDISGTGMMQPTPGSAPGYASSLDGDYFSAPPSRLVSRTPTPVTGYGSAARSGSPDGPTSASAGESDDDDSDYGYSGNGWGLPFFGLGGGQGADARRYRLASQARKKRHRMLKSDSTWHDAHSAKLPAYYAERNDQYDARYSAKHAEASQMLGSRRYARRYRQKSPSMVPAPLRILGSLLGRAFRAVVGPIHPLTILLALALVAGFVTSVTMLIMYILNPDKEPLPWRTYCMQQLPFPHSLADALAPVNILVGVMTVDSKFERRNIIRNTYARHTVPRDANGNPTGNVQVKFVLGKVRRKYASRIALEMEAYNDIVVLDLDETQSARKTHGFLKWAAENATVPFLRPIGENVSAHARDGVDAFVPSRDGPGGLVKWQDDERSTAAQSVDQGPKYEVGWKKVDYVVKADDDSFIVLDELERHLRVAPRQLTYWGYLIKNWFMGGEAYALSHDLVDWMAHSPEVSKTAKGKEDIRTPQWIALHPNRSSINWVSEHCWIYDHPKGNTPYSHGFLFPDYVEKIKLEGRYGLSEQEIAARGGEHASHWYSTVSKWHQNYRAPRHGLTAEESVEALVEGGGRWNGTWVRGNEGSQSERWIPYHDIVYEATDKRLRPSATDDEGRAVLAQDAGMDQYSGLPIYGKEDSGSAPLQDPQVVERAATADTKAQAPAPRRTSQDRRDLLSDLSSIPRKYLTGNSGDQVFQGSPRVHLATQSAAVRYLPPPAQKDGHGEWEALRAERYLHRPHGGTVIVHYLKRTEWWLETALALSGRGKLWTNGAGGRGGEWRMGGSPLVRADGYISEGRGRPQRSTSPPQRGGPALAPSAESR